jgi:outer membrane protein assembly factor BamB
MTGHAAATAASDGDRVVAWFGNAGAVCYSLDGDRLWHRRFGEFESELGLASSPVIYRDRVIFVCDHDGDRFSSFDSFLVALDLKTGSIAWKTDRPGLFRSWSTPLLVPGTENRPELIVNAQDQLRAYDPDTGKQLWQVGGMTGWVTPSPVFGHGLVFACSGKDGPTIAVRPGGNGDVTGSHVFWKDAQGAPYVCSPVLYGEYLYVLNETGIVRCYQATTGKLEYQQRVEGKYFASPVAGDGKVFVTNDGGTTFVLRAGPHFELLSRNSLDDFCLASPALSDGEILIRTERYLYCIVELPRP